MLASNISAFHFFGSNQIIFVSLYVGHANLYLSFEPQWRTQAIGSTIFPSFQLGNEYLIPGIAGMDTFACLIRVNIIV